jgi:UDP-glucose 4-epimerase
MRIYVTGGTGFIGSYVVKQLSNEGHEVVVLARKPEKVPALSMLPGVKIVCAPMEDLKAVEKAIVKPDAVVHIALCWGDTGPEMIKNETLSSVSLIEIAVKKGAKKFIFTSSTAAQGSLPRTIDETEKPKPNDFYGATKGSVELFISAYSNYFKKIKFNTIRPGYTFGDPVVHGGSMENDKRFFNICANARAGSQIDLVKNDGTQFIWAGDLAKVYSALLKSSVTNNVYYGLAKNFTTWEQAAIWAVEYAGKNGISPKSSKIRLKNLGWSDSPFMFNVNRIKKDFGLSFDSTRQIRAHVHFLMEHPELYADK